MDGNLNNNNGAINPSINEKKAQTFNLIIGIATLLIAIFGATFAYFTATARSREGEVTVKSAMVSINFDRGTEIKANNLIPSTEDVALYHYQKPDQNPQDIIYDPQESGPYIQDYDEFVEAGDLTEINRYLDRRCIDSKGKEVCYVFWFSVNSDGEVGGETDILAYIRVEKNEFENLSYLVYEVDYETDENTNIYHDKYGFGVVKTYTPVSDFDPDPSAPIQELIPYGRFKDVEDVYEEGEFVDTKHPVACLFGEVDDASEMEIDQTSRCVTKKISNQTPHYYQIVIWLEETGSEQLEQGKTFNGTVSVEVSGDSSSDGYANGHITGQR